MRRRLHSVAAKACGNACAEARYAPSRIGAYGRRTPPEGGCALIVRRAREDDCEKIARVKRAVWETTYRGIYPDEKIDGFDFSAQAEKF